jgi:hypothetical protein
MTVGLTQEAQQLGAQGAVDSLFEHAADSAKSAAVIE